MLLGVTGTDGAGKGTVVRYLVREHGFVHYPARDVIVAEIKRRALPVDRATMRLVANDLRKQYGDDYIVAHYLQQYQTEQPAKAVIESIRTLAEAESLKAAGGYLLAVDAAPKVRYERIVRRGSASDHVTYEEFLAQEQLEMEDPDPHGMQKGAVMAMADHTVANNNSIPAANRDVTRWLMTLC